MEKTLIILKPDCIKNNLIGEVLNRMCKNSLNIVAIKMQNLSEKILCDHYKHHAKKPYFPEILKFMQSSHVLILVLKGKNAIENTRNLLGATDSEVALKGTIRGDMGKNKMENIAHASDSKESAEIEIKRFFKVNEIFN